MSLSKTVFVTGASRGIGLLTVKTLASNGCHVFAGVRDSRGRNAGLTEELQAWAAAEGHRLEVVDVDVTNDSSVSSAVESIERQAPLDVLVNNAGVMPVGVTEAYTPDQLAACLDVNALGVMRTCRAVLPAMRSRNSGLIISISSTAGRLAIPYFGVYCASKWAMEALVESMHYELEPFAVESILVEPGGHATDLIKSPPSPEDSQRLASYGDSAATPGKMIAMFEQMFAAGDEPTNAQNVADAINGLIASEAPRPLRTTVGNDMGVNQINERTAPIQHELATMIAALRAAG